ncbi:hypothetical protein MWU54_01795 [Marivita sp. S6314]|uniref:hypothetical protein n=1 Tax=Marivita sp. S6314 TaxID=2926406 RepID=UPI001FF474E7|nr:hypothetical protein [Marivita sp. S6314]MCK0148740.1 hypothetical protein [Marivita sp. S6314]
MYDTKATYLACPAQCFCVDFGVYRGESIGYLDDLNLGDMYQMKRDAPWTEVMASDEDATGFDLHLAANAPVQTLTTLARLIFMTTTGRRADVCVTMSDGHLFLVSEQPLQSGAEYVLIDIERCDADFTPYVVPAPAVVPQPVVQTGSNVIPLHAHG